LFAGVYLFCFSTVVSPPMTTVRLLAEICIVAVSFRLFLRVFVLPQVPRSLHPSLMTPAPRLSKSARLFSFLGWSPPSSSLFHGSLCGYPWLCLPSCVSSVPPRCLVSSFSDFPGLRFDPPVQFRKSQTFLTIDLFNPPFCTFAPSPQQQRLPNLLVCSCLFFYCSSY